MKLVRPLAITNANIPTLNINDLSYDLGPQGHMINRLCSKGKSFLRDTAGSPDCAG